MYRGQKAPWWSHFHRERGISKGVRVRKIFRSRSGFLWNLIIERNPKRVRVRKTRFRARTGFLRNFNHFYPRKTPENHPGPGQWNSTGNRESKRKIDREMDLINNFLNFREKICLAKCCAKTKAQKEEVIVVGNRIRGHNSENCWRWEKKGEREIAQWPER